MIKLGKPAMKSLQAGFNLIEEAKVTLEQTTDKKMLIYLLAAAGEQFTQAAQDVAEEPPCEATET